MADYYPLIAKAVSGLEKSTGEARRALYDRARAALVAQLRGVTPALVESDITRERLSLEEAIRRVETEAARRSRTDLPPRPTPAPSSRVPSPPPGVPPAPETEARRAAPPPIRVSPPAAPSFSEPDPIAEDAGAIEPPVEISAPAAPVPPPERPRWMPGSGPSISDRGLKGFRDVVTDKAGFGGASTPTSKAPPGQPATFEPPPGADFAADEPPAERRREFGAGAGTHPRSRSPAAVRPRAAAATGSGAAGPLRPAPGAAAAATVPWRGRRRGRHSR